MSASTMVRYCFGNFELQPAERLLLKAGAPVAIRPRAFDVLVALVERYGHLVTTEDLLGKAWPGVIVEENAVHAQVSALRKLLGPEAIKTVLGGGYRFAMELAGGYRNIVLVHGGFVDGSGWEYVYKILKKAGYGVASFRTQLYRWKTMWP